MNGYHGKFLKVDLTKQVVEDMPLADDDLQKYIGGSTLAAKLIYSHVKRGMDPLAPDSPLLFATGPFQGSPIPMASRFAVCGISPLTGYWGEATSGGEFAVRLKGSGYDGIFVTGRASRPVYLHLENGSARIESASGLWGKDIYKTQDLLRAKIGTKHCSIACIGAGGEKMIPYAAVMNDAGRAAARCGLGALMGSKNLKAVVAAGNKRPEAADKDGLRDLARQGMTTIRKSMMNNILKEFGTLMYTDMGMILGDVPAKYFTKNVFPSEKVTGTALRQKYTVENYACLGCPIGCGREVKNFRPNMPSVDGPEYETTAAFGPLCMNTDLDSIIMANHLCNAHGIDTISAGVSVAYAFYLAERGALTSDMIGFPLKWGDGKAVVKLVRAIISRKGIGALLSKGTLRMARELGRPEGEAAQVKGMEIPMHEGRAFHGLAVSYATSPRGACHLKGDYFNVDSGAGVPELGITSTGKRMNSAHTGERAAKYQSVKDLYDTLALCKFAPLSATYIAQALTAITGKSYDAAALLAVGDRSLDLKRAISIKLGLTRSEDKLPDICIQPLNEGATSGTSPDMDMLLNDYYLYRGWDWETGKPTKEKLRTLDLGWVADDLYGL